MFADDSLIFLLFFCILQNLTHLNLMSNQFTGLSSCFGSLTNLIELNVAANRLTDVSMVGVGSLVRLRKLILRDNLIVSVPNLQALTQLSVLDLSNNRIHVRFMQLFELKLFCVFDYFY